MLPYNINNVTPDNNQQAWSRGILLMFSNDEYLKMRYQGFWYLPDALERNAECKAGEYFALYDRKSQMVIETAYVIESCTPERIVAKVFDGNEVITIEGEDLKKYLIVFMTLAEEDT